ncbi:MAG: RNA polymerase sigma factor [Polyangiaceae bacterium]|nr:RNA polymerase sigma factor [Polyangiaceae bacterium]
MTAPDLAATIAAIFRIESARLIGYLTRRTGDVGRAEELAQDALVAALEQWPETGLPRNPGAWLMAAAKHRALSGLAREKMLARKHAELAYMLDATRSDEEPEAAVEDIGDDVLRLIFTACHPVLPPEARVALTLRLLGGLETTEIARAFLVPEPTMAQRLVRAKRTLAEKRVPFEIPGASDLAPRLDGVLETLYLIFNEGYAATGGTEYLRPELCEEAMRLGRVLTALAPAEPEVHGLLALMELHASRLATRTTRAGDPILLLDQDRSKWDRLLVQRGLAGVEQAEALHRERRTQGFYTFQASLSACHARARTAEETDWPRIAGLYAQLLRLRPSPVVALNFAVAVGMAEGPAAGLALMDSLRDEAALAQYHLLPAARADLLEKLGRLDEAASEFERAAALTANERQRTRLGQRAAACRKSLARG